jgi:hypothetical protein
VQAWRQETGLQRIKREASYRQEQSWLRKMLGFWKESVFYQVPWEAIAEKLLNEKYPQ